MKSETSLSESRWPIKIKHGPRSGARRAEVEQDGS